MASLATLNQGVAWYCTPRAASFTGRGSAQGMRAHLTCIVAIFFEVYASNMRVTAVSCTACAHIDQLAHEVSARLHQDRGRMGNASLGNRLAGIGILGIGNSNPAVRTRKNEVVS